MPGRRLLLILALGNVVVGTGAFVLPALLAPLAADLGIPLSAAGWLMSGYALAYAVGSPLLTAMTGRWPRRRVLLSGLALLALGNLAVGLAPDVTAAHLGRIVAALGGALFTPIAASVAVATAPPERRARDLALVFAGMTVAQVAGIPLGSLLSDALGWRAVFLVVAAAALVAFAVIRLSVPGTLTTPAATLPQLGRMLRDPGAMLALAVCLLFFAGQFTVITFLGPVITKASGLTGGGLALLLWVFGLAGVAANLLGGALADRIGPERTIVGLILASSVALVLLPALDGSPWLAALVLAAWGLTGYAFMTPQQSRLVTLMPWAQGLALSLNASALYAGSAIGGAAGGAVVASAGLGALGVAGALILLLALLALRLSTGRRPSPPEAAGPPVPATARPL